MIYKVFFILIIITLTILTSLFSQDISNTKQIGEDENPELNLQAIEISGNYFSPIGGIDISAAKGIIITELVKRGIKGDINSAIILNEITNKESWENMGVQIYQVDVNYAWLNGIAVINNKNVLTILDGMPTETVFLADLDKDSIYEIYTNVFFGSGVVSKEIRGYNIPSNETYYLSMRMEKDLHLFIENGILMAEIRPYENQLDKNITIGKVLFKKHENKNELTIE